jgi:hypothetical protein
MALTPYPGTKPQRNDRATFSERADAFATWLLDTFWDELDAALEAFNFNATNSTSTTSLLISVASKTLTVQASKSYVAGMAVTIAYTTDPTQWMRGEVISYDSVTGALVVNVRYISDSVGTYTAWTISQASIESSVADSNILCVTGNGRGSTNTYIRLLTTTTYNTGTAFTVVHSATLGTYITINEPGVYSCVARDSRGGSTAAKFALTKNASVLTGSPILTECLGHAQVEGTTASGAPGVFSVTDRLNTNDIIRLQDYNLNDGGAGNVSIWIRKIGNV